MVSFFAAFFFFYSPILLSKGELAYREIIKKLKLFIYLLPKDLVLKDMPSKDSFIYFNVVVNLKDMSFSLN